MAALIRVHGTCPIYRARPRSFNILAWSIISQQLSTKAAHTIAGRVLELCGTRELTAAGVLSVSRDALRGAGLSWRKVDYLLAIASAHDDGSLNVRQLAQLDDDRVIERLVDLPGIGEWTAQMYLMFALRRADVFSPADVGLQRAAHELYGLKVRPSGDAFAEFAQRWRPWRTVASWYLWRHAD